MGHKMTEFVKVCVKVPAGKENDVMSLAAELRAEVSNRRPGWDSKMIHEIASKKFGGLASMFEFHGWPERGISMMPAVQRHVFEEYGSVEKFAEKYGTSN